MEQESEMTRAIACVATGSYVKGMNRLSSCHEHFAGAKLCTWADCLPDGSPSHGSIPYAFKGFALRQLSNEFETLLWCDACIMPIRSMEPLFERIERDGYWISRNGWSNDQWTADSAYKDLWPGLPIEDARKLNSTIPHVVATSFGLSMKHEIGRAFLTEYFRLASETTAFRGPWTNYLQAGHPTDVRCAPCGPPEVLGHRHDQSAASVIAWRLGMKLTDPPNIFAYNGGETENTILLAHGGY